MIHKFLNDSLDLLLDGLAALGLLRGGAAWTRQRWARGAERAEAEAESVRRSVAATHRMCRSCRELVPRAERTCTACGASMSGIPAGGLGRLLGWVVPGFGSVSTAILTGIVLAYAACLLTGGSLFSPLGSPLIQAGAKQGEAIFLFGEWWRLITAVYLHGNLLHLGMNAYSLSMLGPFVEHEIGPRKLLVVYTLTGIGSFAISSWWNPRIPSLGASGAIFGLIGFGVVYGRRSASTRLRGASSYLLQWALLGALMIFMGGIDHAAHFGGFAVGCLLGLVVDGSESRSAAADRAWSLLAAACALLPVIGFVLAALHHAR